MDEQLEIDDNMYCDVWDMMVEEGTKQFGNNEHNRKYSGTML